ncbi:M4 family metallopeptidase [Providencia sp. Me31A]|uniref:M4 family metallopeptidase n=1 Tax=Providencia sp. Me31A TaxID=3392637 RepID=UPI003D2A422E
MSQILGRSLLSPCLISSLVAENSGSELKPTLMHINDIMSRLYSDEDVRIQRELFSNCPINMKKGNNRLIRDAQRSEENPYHDHSNLPICQRDQLTPNEHMPHDDFAIIMQEGDVKAPSLVAAIVYDSIGTIRSFFKDKLNINQIFGCTADINAIIHYGTNYANAFWNSQAIFFGDGDGTTFGPFYNDIDIIAHELSHGYINSKANFEYIYQSGALNESVADVLGIMVKQFVRQETVDESNWLIGENLFIDRYRASALRSMANPGSAYRLSDTNRDPQVGHMSEFRNLPYYVDNGGVHINSGIPNKAFYLLAMELGGYSWDIAGKIWVATVSDPEINESSNFIDFATATVWNAKNLFDGNIALKTQQSWESVGLPLSNR